MKTVTRYERDEFGRTRRVEEPAENQGAQPEKKKGRDRQEVPAGANEPKGAEHGNI